MSIFSNKTWFPLFLIDRFNFDDEIEIINLHVLAFIMRVRLGIEYAFNYAGHHKDKNSYSLNSIKKHFQRVSNWGFISSLSYTFLYTYTFFHIFMPINKKEEIYV